MSVGSPPFARSSNRSSFLCPSRSVTKRDWTRCIRLGQDRQRAQLAVGEAPRRRRHLEGDRPDSWRGRQEERLVRAAALRDDDRAARVVCREAEAGREVLVRLGVEDLEREAPLQLAFRRVVDDDLQLGPVPLAQEARHVGTDHQLLDALRLLLQRAAAQVLRDGVEPDVPGGHGVGDRELDRRGAVGSRQELRRPERRLGEVAPQGRGLARGGRRTAGVFLRLALVVTLLVRIHLRHLAGRSRRRGGSGRRGVHRHALGDHRRAHAAPHSEPAPAGPRPTDAVPVELLQAVRQERGGRRGRVEAADHPLGLRRAERRARPRRSDARRVEREDGGRLVRREDVEAPVVHVAEQLCRAGFDRLSGGRLHRDPPRLARPGTDPVAERRELQLQLLVVPRDEDRRRLAHPLVIPEGRERDAEPAAVLLRDRDLENRVPFSGLQDRAREERPRAEPLEEHRLTGKARRREETCRLPHPDRPRFHEEDERDRGCLPPTGHEEVPERLVLRPEVVDGRVANPPRAGVELPEVELREAVGSVNRLAPGLLGAVAEVPQHALHVEGGLPAGAQGVSGRRVRCAFGCAFLSIGRRAAAGQIGRERGRRRGNERDEPPASLAGTGRAVEARPRDRRGSRLLLARRSPWQSRRAPRRRRTRAAPSGSRCASRLPRRRRRRSRRSATSGRSPSRRSRRPRG